MSCESCREAQEIDGVIPDCEKERGCLIPPLDERGKRIMGLRGKIITLKELLPADVILKMYQATIDDIELLAAVEEEIKKNIYPVSQPSRTVS